MKKIHFAILSLALLPAGISSCSKTNTKKVSNDWKVTAYELTGIQNDENGNKVTYTYSSNGSFLNSSITTVTADGSSTTNTLSEKVEKDDFIINEDGTWSWDTRTSYSVGEVIIYKSVTTNEISGTWNFAGQSKEEGFKKNERIIFHKLKSDRNIKETSTIIATGQTINVNESGQTDSYLPGEDILTYTVLESEKDKLQLSAESDHVYTQSMNTSTHTTSLKMTLTKK